MNIILIGMRGAGKSNVSRRLSVLVKRPVFSTDALIEYENGGQSIADFVAAHGGDWRAFRELEFEVTRKVAKMDNIIVDTGGGIVVDLDAHGNEVFSERKVETLKSCGKIVWLKGDIPTLVEKVKNKPDLPPLDALKSAEEMMYRRLPFYERAADVVIDITGRKRSQMAKTIARMFERQL